MFETVLESGDKNIFKSLQKFRMFSLTFHNNYWNDERDKMAEILFKIIDDYLPLTVDELDFHDLCRKNSKVIYFNVFEMISFTNF